MSCCNQPSHVQLPQGKGCEVSTEGSKPKFHKGAELDRVNDFILGSEALTNQAEPDSRKPGLSFQSSVCPPSSTLTRSNTGSLFLLGSSNIC